MLNEDAFKKTGVWLTSFITFFTLLFGVVYENNSKRRCFPDVDVVLLCPLMKSGSVNSRREVLLDDSLFHWITSTIKFRSVILRPPSTLTGFLDVASASQHGDTVCLLGSCGSRERGYQ